MVNAVGEILWANRTFADFVCEAHDSLAGQPFLDYIDASDPFQLLGVDALLADASISEQEIIFRCGGCGESGSVCLTMSRGTVQDGGTRNTLFLLRSSGTMREALAESSRRAAREQQRADELSRARDALEKANAEIRETQTEMVRLSRMAGIAEVASNVLHNIGNVLNSVVVSVELVTARASEMPVDRLDRLHAMMEGVAKAIPSDQKLQQIPPFLAAVARALDTDRLFLRHELEGVRTNLDHIKAILSVQQKHAKTYGVLELTTLGEVVHEAASLSRASFSKHKIDCTVLDEANQPSLIDRHRVVQILVNLLSNAKDAVRDRGPGAAKIDLRAFRDDTGDLVVSVTDNGVGIPAHELDKIFEHGFTSKTDGHGFGLHAAANAAAETGGSIVATSEGVDRGAKFILRLPFRSGIGSTGAFAVVDPKHGT